MSAVSQCIDGMMDALVVASEFMFRSENVFWGEVLVNGSKKFIDRLVERKLLCFDLFTVT